MSANDVAVIGLEEVVGIAAGLGVTLKHQTTVDKLQWCHFPSVVKDAD